MLEIIFSRNEASNEGQLLSIKLIDRMDPITARPIQLHFILISSLMNCKDHIKLH